MNARTPHASVHPSQHVNATKIANLEPLMPNVAATSIIVNVTPPSASILLRNPVQRVMNELFVMLQLVVQLPDASLVLLPLDSLPPVPQPLVTKPLVPQPFKLPQQPRSLLLKLQQSHHAHQSMSVLIPKDDLDVMVKLGLTNPTHVLNTVASTLTTSKHTHKNVALDSMSKPTVVQTNANEFTYKMLAALNILVKLLLARTLNAPF